MFSDLVVPLHCLILRLASLLFRDKSFHHILGNLSFQGQHFSFSSFLKKRYSINFQLQESNYENAQETHKDDNSAFTLSTTIHNFL